METTAAAPRRSPLGWAFLAVIAGAVLLVAAGIVVAAVVSHTQQTVSYRANSPEGTVQRYLNLLQSGKTDAAYRMTQIDDGGLGIMSRPRFHQQFDNWSETSHTVTLDSTTSGRGEASVTVEISSFSGGPFSASTGSNRVTFTLSKVGRRWLLTGPSYLP